MMHLSGMAGFDVSGGGDGKGRYLQIQKASNENQDSPFHSPVWNLTWPKGSERKCGE
jgi:hypothetical protein